MYKVKIYNNIKPDALERLDSSKYSISSDIEDPNIIIVRSAHLHNIELGEDLLCIARAGAGTNNIPVERCADEGIVVFNTPGANAESVVELVLCGMLLSSRDILGGIDWVKANSAGESDIRMLVEKEKSRFAGPEIYGKTLGVIGLGAIGARIARSASALGMQVYGYDPYLTVEAAWKLPPEIIYAGDLDTVYKNSDYITIHVPYLESTHNMINKDSIARMKQGVRLLNLARAELVCDDDLIEALSTGRVSRYVTDFPTEKTVGVPGIIATPHIGATTPESEDNCVSMACSEIIEYIEHGNILNSVNMAHSYLPRSGDPRICVIHYNIPEMIAKITSTLSTAGINIENMINTGSKGKTHAYTMLDVNVLPDDIGDTLKKIRGVTKVRLLEA